MVSSKTSTTTTTTKAKTNSNGKNDGSRSRSDSVTSVKSLSMVEMNKKQSVTVAQGQESLRQTHGTSYNLPPPSSMTLRAALLLSDCTYQTQPGNGGDVGEYNASYSSSSHTFTHQLQPQSTDPFASLPSSGRPPTNISHAWPLRRGVSSPDKFSSSSLSSPTHNNNSGNHASDNKSNLNMSHNHSKKSQGAWSKPLVGGILPSVPSVSVSSSSVDLNNMTGSGTNANGNGNGNDVKSEFVFLLSRPYLQNWIKWASDQPVPMIEEERLKTAIRTAAERHGLEVPPSCRRPPQASPPKRTTSIVGMTTTSDSPPKKQSQLQSSTGTTTSSTTSRTKTKIRYKNPGPIDVANLSVLGHPLLLRSQVVVGKGYYDHFNNDDGHDADDKEESSTSRSTNNNNDTSSLGSSSDPFGSIRKSVVRPRAPSPPVRVSRPLGGASSVTGGGATSGGRTRSASTSRVGLRRPLVRSRSFNALSSGGGGSGPPRRGGGDDGNGGGGGGFGGGDARFGIDPHGNNYEIGCCAVPEKFYELLRSVHGVKCTDGVTISFQPPNPDALSPECLHHHVVVPSSSTKKGLGRGGGGGNKSTSSSSSTPAARPPSPPPSRGTDIRRPFFASSLTNGGGGPSGHHALTATNATSLHSNSRHNPPRPIEFRRQVVGEGRQSSSSSSSSQKTISKRRVVEVYPIKLIYSVLSETQFGGIGGGAGSSATGGGSSVGGNGSSPTSSTTSTSILGSTNKNSNTDSMKILKAAASRLSASAELSTSGGGTTTTTKTTTTLRKSSHKPKATTTKTTTPRFRSFRRFRVGDRAVGATFAPNGFILVSRDVPVWKALQWITQAAAPEKSSACVRVWCRLGHASLRVDGITGATRANNGYEVFGIDEIKHSQPELTVREWVERIHGRKVSDGCTCTTTMTTVSSSVGGVKSEVNSNANTTDDHDVVWGGGTTAGEHVEVVVETRHCEKSSWNMDGYELENRISVGDFVDAQDTTGKWYEARVKEVLEDDIKVHYFGWSSKWDGIIPKRRSTKKEQRFPGPPAPLWTHTGRWREFVKVGSEVEIRESSSIVQRPRWFKAIVREVGGEHDTVRKIVGGADLELFDIVDDSASVDDDNNNNSNNVPNVETKKAPLLLLGRTRQVLVEVPQERFNTSIPTTSKSYRLTKVTSTPTTTTSSSTNWAGSVGVGVGVTGALHMSSSSSILPSSLSSPLCPQPPFVRWVNLYGEEICELYTHNPLPPPAGNGGGISDDQPTPPVTIDYALVDPTRPPVEIMKSYNNIHGSGFIRESLRGVPPAPGSVGLHNLGNSCFMNSILQCLNHIHPLTQYFLRGDYRRDLNRDNPLGSGGIVALAYAVLVNDMWGGEFSILVPREMKRTVAVFAPQFDNSFQHDSQEFCSFLMDGLHEDLNRRRDKPYVEDVEGFGRDDDAVALESWKNHLLRHDSVIVDHCQGLQRSHLKCPQCGHESVKFDVYSTISLPVPNRSAEDASSKTDNGNHNHNKNTTGNVKVKTKTKPTHNTSVTLADCLERYTSAEQLDDRNAWYCPHCKDHVCAEKLINLWSTPDILILHLKRFSFDTCKRRPGGLVRTKVDDCVVFPVDGLDMSPYTMGPQDPDAPPIYKLFGVSEHTGATANSGHYTATVRNSKDGKWYKYNDSNVGITSADASITGGAYLLFYQRNKSNLRWAGMEKYMKGKGIDPFTPSRSIGMGTNNEPKVDKDGFTEVKSKKKKKRVTNTNNNNNKK